MRVYLVKEGLCRFLWMGFMLGLIIIVPIHLHVQGTPVGNATISLPVRVGGVSGYGDEQDADLYPKIAYDFSGGRYLAVWMTPRNAGSSSDGFDVYGVFLNCLGQQTGNEFRISDTNTAAWSSFRLVVAGKGEFVVIWTSRGASCQIIVQRVTDTSYRTDQVLVSGNGHRHSPSLVYNPERERYALADVEGDDYLPPTSFGAQTADCGNNASSVSSIKQRSFTSAGIPQ